MKFFIISVVILLSAKVFGIEAKNCTEYQTELMTEARLNSSHVIDNLIQDIDFAREDRSLDKHTLKKLVKAKYILSCAKDRIKTMNLSCYNDNTDYCAWTLPLVGNTVHASKGVLDLFKLETATSFLIHEGTHKCGTTDLGGTNEYGRFYDYINPGLSTAPKSAWYIEWHNIASTYDFWAIKGFCIPGKNCEEVLLLGW